jgi:hypothetical protein
MGILITIATKLGTWLLEKGAVMFVAWLKARSRVSKRDIAIDDEVRAVEVIAKEMKARRKAGLPRDTKLEQEMKHALRNLNIKYKFS